MTTHNTANDEAQIRRSIETFVQGVRKKDVDQVMSIYAPDVLVFDVVPPTRRGVAEYRRGIQEWFGMFEGPIEFEVHDLKIMISADLAVTHSVSHQGGTMKDGRRNEGWVRT